MELASGEEPSSVEASADDTDESEDDTTDDDATEDSTDRPTDDPTPPTLSQDDATSGPPPHIHPPSTADAGSTVIGTTTPTTRPRTIVSSPPTEPGSDPTTSTPPTQPDPDPTASTRPTQPDPTTSTPSTQPDPTTTTTTTTAPPVVASPPDACEVETVRTWSRGVEVKYRESDAFADSFLFYGENRELLYDTTSLSESQSDRVYQDGYHEREWNIWANLFAGFEPRDVYFVSAVEPEGESTLIRCARS
jgi:hypothetical protein